MCNAAIIISKKFCHKKLELLEIIEKKPAKTTHRIEKIYIYQMFTENICSACNKNANGSFLQTCIDFVEQGLKLSHFESSIIL